MKKSGLLLSLAAVMVFANTNKDMQASDTQKKYERKAVLGVDIGIPDRNLPIVHVRCGKKKCIPVELWNYKITQQEEDKISQELYDWLITQRFDKIIINPDEAIILTATKEDKIKLNGDNYFIFNTGDIDAFKKNLEIYLEKLSTTVDKLLKASIKERYNELPEKEQETFIKTKAKELGISPKIAKKLLSSAYVFGVYFIPEKGKMVRVGNQVSYSGANVSISVPDRGNRYSASADIPVKAYVLIYKFDPEKRKFVSYNSIEGESGSGTGNSKSYPSYPSFSDVKPLIDSSLVEGSARAVAISLSATLKEDDNFAIFTTADKVEGKKVEAKIGVLEDLRVDAPYDIRRKVDGNTTIIGFVKAREVAKNCTTPGYSKFDLIKGNIELKDQLREHPWTGAFVTGSIGMENYKVTEFGGVKGSAGGMFTTLKLGAALDLGYATNKKILSEVWFDAFVGFGFGGDEFNFGYYTGDTPMYITAGIGAFKRFYVANSIYVAPGANLNYQLLSASSNDPYVDSYSVGSLSLGLKLNAGYNFSPNFELVGSLGYNLPVSTSGSDSNGGSYEATAEGGINFFLGVQYHIKTVGPLVKLYKKPSTICIEKVKESK